LWSPLWEYKNEALINLWPRMLNGVHQLSLLCYKLASVAMYVALFHPLAAFIIISPVSSSTYSLSSTDGKLHNIGGLTTFQINDSM